MKSYIISSSDVKYETNISMEDTPLEIVKNFCEENPDDAQYIFSNEKAHQQLLRDGELDEAVSVFELRDVEGHLSARSGVSPSASSPTSRRALLSWRPRICPSASSAPLSPSWLLCKEG